MMNARRVRQQPLDCILSKQRHDHQRSDAMWVIEVCSSGFRVFALSDMSETWQMIVLTMTMIASGLAGSFGGAALRAGLPMDWNVAGEEYFLGHSRLGEHSAFGPIAEVCLKSYWCHAPNLSTS
jgi:hypothetical protein